MNTHGSCYYFIGTVSVFIIAIVSVCRLSLGIVVISDFLPVISNRRVFLELFFILKA